MKIVLSRLLQKFGFEINSISGNTKNKRNQYYQIRRLISNKSNPVVFDVGSHKGEMIKKYRNMFPNAIIYAFEPIPECYTEINKIAINDIKLHPFQYAISNTNEKKEFYLNKNIASSSLLSANPKGQKKWGNNLLENTSNIMVQCKTIDKVCKENNIHKIDLLKLDIQGSELDALCGADNLLKNGKIDLIYTEISIFPSYNNQGGLDKIISYLNKFSYNLFNIYKSIHRDGQLMEIDVLFVRSSLL